MILINGALGEGGGQILRTSLGLSLYTGKPFRIENIRANRKKPGLLRQHLTAVNAASEISGATALGARLGATELEFTPGQCKGGQYRFNIGTAGSTTLVLQTLLPVLLTGKHHYEILLEGGTHNMMAPPYDFLDDSFLGVLGEMGAQVHAELLRYGFYPVGGGRFRVKSTGVDALKPLDLTDRGEIVEQGATCMVSQLPHRIASEEAEIVAELMGWPRHFCKSESVKSNGPGNVVLVKLRSEHVTEVFSGFGKKGRPLRDVAEEAAVQARTYLENNLTAGRYLADQLLIPMAIAGGGRFITGKPSLHLETNGEVIKMFMDVEVDCNELDEQRYLVTIKA
ncbi:MAG: RNA 3'-terminal phosphate cyclase [bacterium]|nr:RNA 3'-terminal phosphate cyclase [bacterium]